MNLTLSKPVIIATAAAATLLALTVATETTSLATTHSMNPFNMGKLISFNKFAKVEKNTKAENFETVNAFVKAHGAGLLTATSTDGGKTWSFVYKTSEDIKKEKAAAKEAAKKTDAKPVEVKKNENEVVLKDWAAVAQFLEINAPKTEEKKAEEPKADANAKETAKKLADEAQTVVEEKKDETTAPAAPEATPEAPAATPATTETETSTPVEENNQ